VSEQNELKLGKLPATYDKRDLLFKEFQVGDLKPAPKGFGHGSLVPTWGMLGNDRYGDCVWAGAAHETMMLCAIAKTRAPFNDTVVLQSYEECTGFSPVTGENDNGTNMRDAMNYRRQVGILDANGDRHKIGAFVALEPGNWIEMLEALYIFDFVAIGFEFPASAMDQFNKNKPWAVRSRSPIEGGHYVPVVDRPFVYDNDVVTWGRRQLMTKGFYHKYVDEAYAVLSTESLVSGKTAEGYDFQSLNDALAQFGSVS
jgi:hypothetical protein